MNNLVGQHVSHYQIKALLGAGRIGHVYQAVNMKDASLVALKTIEMEFARQSELRLRFLQEVQAFPRLDHPSIIKIYEAGVDTRLELLYLTMELANGRSLTAWLQQLEYNNRQPDVAEMLILAAQIAEALGYAHQKGVIHRDVRPNVILFKLDDHPEESGRLPGRAAISDFTFSTILEQEKEPYLPALPYMAPEYFLSRPLDGRADLYSLGIVLYRLLTGQLPFPAPTPDAAARQHTQEAPPPPDEIRPGLSPSVAAILLKAIAKNPDGRYQKGAEMAEALRQAAKPLITQRESAAPPAEDLSLAKTQTDPPEYTALNAIWTSKEDRLTVTRNLPHSLNRQIITIGRSQNSDIVLEDMAVSRQHAQLEKTSRGWTVRDLGSQNGTYLDGKPLLPDIPELWSERQTLRIGPWFLHLQPGREYEYEALPFFASVAPEALELRAGEEAALQLTIRNDGANVDTFWLEMLRLPAAWVTLPAETIRLRPNEQTTVTVRIRPPRAETTLLGSYRYLLVVTSQNDEQNKISLPGTITARPAAETFAAKLLPADEKANRFRLFITNNGLHDKWFEISGANPQNRLRYILWQPKAAPETAAPTRPEQTKRRSRRSTLRVFNQLPVLNRLRAAPRTAWDRAINLPRAALNRITPGLGSIVPAAAMPSLGKPAVSSSPQPPPPKGQPTFSRRAYKPTRFPAALFTQVHVPAGQEETVLLEAAPRKRPFYRRAESSLPFDLVIRSEDGQKQTIAGQTTVKPFLRSTPLALALVLLIMLVCSFTFYAYLLRYNPVALAMVASSRDRDGDGLTNFAELYYYETDPNNPDSDGDLLPDNEEIAAGLNPLRADTDRDGLNDSVEMALRTNPRLADTDGDGIPDAAETQLGVNPLITDTLPVIVVPVATIIPPTAVPLASAAAPTPTLPPILFEQTFTSLAAEDGYIVQGGVAEPIISTGEPWLQLGEGETNGSQAKGFLTFNTDDIPPGAAIISATLQLYQTESAGSTNNLGILQVDMAPPEGFGGSGALGGADFTAVPLALNVTGPPAGGGDGRWLNITLRPENLRHINRDGRTRFRLYFTLPNDNDDAPDWLRFASGDANDASLRPKLFIAYER